MAQIMGEAAVDLPDHYFDKPKAEYMARRDLLVQRLNAMPGVFVPNPGGGRFMRWQVTGDDSDNFCQWLLESFSYKGKL
jgi:aspartate aminotransferase